MLTRRRRPPLLKMLVRVERDAKSEQGGDLHNGEDLEEVVFGEVLVWVMWVQLKPLLVIEWCHVKCR